MKTFVLLMLAASDGGTRSVHSDLVFRYVMEPSYWEQGPVGCGNGAVPEARRRDGGVFLVCDARKDGGR